MSKAVAFWYDTATGLFLGSGTTAPDAGVGCTDQTPPPRTDMGEVEERRVFDPKTGSWSLTGLEIKGPT